MDILILVLIMHIFMGSPLTRFADLHFAIIKYVWIATQIEIEFVASILMDDFI